MKAILQLIVLLFICNLQAQNLKGTATYMSQTHIEIKKDSTMKDEMYEQLTAMLAKQMQKEYILTFNGAEMNYKEAQSLDSGPATASSGGMSIVMLSGNPNSLRYRNLETKKELDQKDIQGKLFLVHKDLEELPWTLTKETKNIGQYVCFKATRTYEHESMEYNFEEGKEAEEKLTKKTIHVEAWYTPQIPLGHGPSGHYGLPGLILEVTRGRTKLMCTKVTLSANKEILIKKPKKGKKVSQEKYKEISEKKTKEMMKRMQSGRKGEKGFSISISN